MKKLVLVILLVAVLGVSLITLTGCKVSAETKDNSVEISVDDATKGTFESIIDWITERIDRVID